MPMVLYLVWYGTYIENKEKKILFKINKIIIKIWRFAV